MKYPLLYIPLLFFSLTSMAQTADDKAVSDAVEMMRVAMINTDSATLRALTDDRLSYGHSTGRVENKKEFVGNIVTGKSDFVSIDLSEQTTSVSGGVAVVRHIFSASTNDSGKPGTVKLKVLLIWQKETGKWKLIARQAVKFT